MENVHGVDEKSIFRFSLSSLHVRLVVWSVFRIVCVCMYVVMYVCI